MPNGAPVATTDAIRKRFHHYLNFYGFGMPPAILNTVKDYFQNILDTKKNFARGLPKHIEIAFSDKNGTVVSIITPTRARPQGGTGTADPCYKTSDGKLRRKTVKPFCTGPNAERDDCIWVKGRGCRTKRARAKFSFEDEELKLQPGSTFYFASSSNMMLNDPVYNSKVFAQYMKDKKKINLYKFPGDALIRNAWTK